ncbi:MAG: manganese efflux pump MntP family protein [Phycisphaerae bacterium]
MSWLNLVGIAVGLAMDAFAVSIAAGLTIDGVTPRHVFRIAFHFGLFQFMMPILGWLLGSTISMQVVAYGHWLAFALLSIIGGKMLLDARSGSRRAAKGDPSRGWMLVALSLATSIDALAVGLSMAFLQISIWLPCVVIGLVAALFSAVGITFSGRVLHRWGRVADLVGGCILILIGVRIVVSHQV